MWYKKGGSLAPVFFLETVSAHLISFKVKVRFVEGSPVVCKEWGSGCKEPGHSAMKVQVSWALGKI